jgi:hypothetical protein
MRFKLIAKDEFKRKMIVDFSDYTELLNYVAFYKLPEFVVYDRQTKMFIREV